MYEFLQDAVLFVVISLIAFALDFGNAALFNVMNYGAVGDGKHDDAKVNPFFFF